MEKSPTEPELIKENQELSNEYFESIRRKELFDQFSDLPCVEQYFKKRKPVSDEELDEEFRKYIEKRYPDSDDEIEIKRINNELSNVSKMTDDEVLRLLKAYARVVKHAGFSAQTIREVLSIYFNFSGIGFNVPIAETELMTSCKKVIEKDPQGALDNFRRMSFYYDNNKQARKIIEALSDFARKAQIEQLSKLINNNSIPLSAGLSQIKKYNFSHLYTIRPEIITEQYKAADPNEQEAIRTFLYN